MSRVLLGGIACLCLVLIWYDGQNFCVPVAFVLCILALWKKGSKALRNILNDYQNTINKNLSDAKDKLLTCQNILENAEKKQAELSKTIESIFQTAHQEAAFILKKNQNDMDVMQESQRRQLEIQTNVSRQKWKAALGNDVLVAMEAYIRENSSILPSSSNAIGTISEQTTTVLGHCPRSKDCSN
jgi:F0F1-type ATP synthase membrane subunit b/b'